MEKNAGLQILEEIIIALSEEIERREQAQEKVSEEQIKES